MHLYTYLPTSFVFKRFRFFFSFVWSNGTCKINCGKLKPHEKFRNGETLFRNSECISLHPTTRHQRHLSTSYWRHLWHVSDQSAVCQCYDLCPLLVPLCQVLLRGVGARPARDDVTPEAPAARAGAPALRERPAERSQEGDAADRPMPHL